MAKDRYMSELKRVMTDPTPPAPTTLSRAEIEAKIAEISATLKHPLSNVQRLWLVEDRRELRKQLELAE